MNAEIILKNIDNEIFKRLQTEANRRGIDLNSYIIKIFRKVVGLDTEKDHDDVHHDLDYLAGTWTAEEAEAFNKATGDFNKIDKELWQ